LIPKLPNSEKNKRESENENKIGRNEEQLLLPSFSKLVYFDFFAAFKNGTRTFCFLPRFQSKIKWRIR